MISILIIGHRAEGGGSVFSNTRNGGHARDEAGGQSLGSSTPAEVLAGCFLESSRKARQPLTRLR